MRNQYDKSKIIEFLSERPFQSHACKKIGLSKATFYRWVKDNPEFRKEVEKALQYGRSNMCDVAEAMLMKRTTEGDMNAIRFVLKNLDPRYMDKRSVYVEPPKHVHGKLEPWEKCGECGHYQPSKEATESIVRAFKNYGIIKDENDEIK